MAMSEGGVDTRSLEEDLCGGNKGMDAYLEPRTGVEIIAEIRAILSRNTTSLRDEFAGQALAGMMSVPSGDDPSATAVYAYRLADALLAARGRS